MTSATGGRWATTGRSWKRRTARNRLSEDVAAVGGSIRGARNADAVLRRTVELLHSTLACSVEAWMPAPDGEDYVLRAVAPGREAGPVSAAPVLVRSSGRSGSPGTNPITHEAAIPVVAAGTTAAVLHLTGRMFSATELRFVDALVREVGIGLELAALYERVAAEKEKGEAVLNRIADAVVVTDPRGVVTEWNPAAERLTSCGAAAAVGLRCEDALGLCDESGPLDCSSACPLARDDDPQYLGREVWRVLPDRRQPVLASAQEIRAGDGSVASVVHSLRDITRLKEADEAKTLFLATTSHELKTPLTVIKGFTDMLLAGTDDEEVRQNALSVISRRVGELTSIVERLLLSSRVEAGRVEVAAEAVDVGAVVREQVSALAGASGREVTCDVDRDVPLAAADSRALVTVVEHLLDNAIKYSPEGTAVRVSVGVEGRFVLVTVADDGIGMDAEQAAHCFDKFWQAESRASRRFGGTGIGLYLVRALVVAMGGSISVASAPGQGSTFSVRLPTVGVAARASSLGASDERSARAADPSVIREFMRQIGIPERRGS